MTQAHEGLSELSLLALYTAPFSDKRKGSRTRATGQPDPI
jgi:hypothetical protein